MVGKYVGLLNFIVRSFSKDQSMIKGGYLGWRIYFLLLSFLNGGDLLGDYR